MMINTKGTFLDRLPFDIIIRKVICSVKSGGNDKNDLFLFSEF